LIRLVKYLLYVLFLPVWWLQILVPRKNDIWVFGAWHGHRYSDNSRSLFLYVKKNHPEIKPIWLTRNKKVVEQVRADGGIAFLANSRQGIWHSLIAKNIFVSCVKNDVNPLFINGANWIQLWHGSPAKKIGRDDKFSNANSFFQKGIVDNFFPFASEYNYHKIVSNASFFSPILASAFGVPQDRIIETGSPRNDVFKSLIENPFNTNLRDKFPNCKILYYLPTFRGTKAVNSIFGLADYDPKKVDTFLEQQNLVLVSKAHYIDNKIDKIDTTQERLVHLADEDVIDINEMLKDADLLITDYSSIYFDYLLTEKPVIFAAFDLAEYIGGNRELPFKYEEVVAGPIVKNWLELFNSLKAIFNNENYKPLIKEKNLLFNKYHDDQNSKRVFDKISY